MKLQTFIRLLRTTAIASLTATWLGSTPATANDHVAVLVIVINNTDRCLNTYTSVLIGDESGYSDNGIYGIPPKGSFRMCCFGLPLQWRPGIRASVQYESWNAEYPEIEPSFFRDDLPPYKDEPTMLWVLFHSAEDVEVVASTVTPDHPQWPGSKPGWPKPGPSPTLSDNARLLAAITVLANAGRHRTPEQLAIEWEGDALYRPQEITHFSGPEDPAYVEHLRQRYRDVEFYLHVQAGDMTGKVDGKPLCQLPPE